VLFCPAHSLAHSPGPLPIDPSTLEGGRQTAAAVVTKNKGMRLRRVNVLVTTHNTLRTMLLFYHQPRAALDRGCPELVTNVS
jgi:hypothetical protein